MRTVLRIAWRSIWRNRRRTLISMSAVGVGLMLVIFYGGLMAGVLGEAVNDMDATGMGHVEITAPGWREHRGIEPGIPRPAEVLAALELPPGAQAGARVIARGLASSAWGSRGVEILGVDLADEARLSLHLRDVREGELLSSDDARGVVLGERLAARLKLKAGSKVRLMVSREGGELGAQLFRVRGVFHSLSPAISESRVYVTSAAADALLGVADVAHLIAIQLPRAADADAVAARLQQELGPRLEVRSYGQLLPALRNIEKLSDSIVLVAALFVYGLTGLGILNTMLMSVLERTREFGVLRAIGTSPGRVVAQVLGESFWIATISGTLGLAAGLLLTWYGSTHALVDIGGGESLEYMGAVMRSAVKTRFAPLEALRAASLVYLMALLTALYPAWRVARLPPAKALHSA